MLERGFLIFFKFFATFFRNFLARVEYERNLGQNFCFFSFLASLYPYWIEIMPELSFLIFWIVLLFFLEFSCLGQVWTEFGTKIFFSLSWPISSVLAKNNNRKRFFYFLNFFAIFFRIFLPGSSMNGIGGKNFFPSFSASLKPFWTEIMSEVFFFNFFNFFENFFWNFLARVGHEQNSELKFFFLFLGLSHPVLAENNVGLRFFNFFNFFAIFFEIFLPESGLNGIRK